MKRGFGSPHYNRARAQAIREAGNRALREAGKAHSFTSETGREAARKHVRTRLKAAA